MLMKKEDNNRTPRLIRCGYLNNTVYFIPDDLSLTICVDPKKEKSARKRKPTKVRLAQIQEDKENIIQLFQQNQSDFAGFTSKYDMATDFHHVYQITESDMLSGKIDKLFYSIDKNTLNKLLSVFLTSLKKNYRENPNVEDIDLWINKYDISQCSVRSLLDLFDKEMFNLTVGAEILIQIAIIYIHSGEIGRVKLARDYLFRAVKIYLNQTIHDEIAFKRIVYSRWLIAVTFKQERNFGYANELCEELIEYINDENEVFGIPFSDSLLLPQRELVVINKEEIMSDYLLFHMEDITINPKELFYTHRRLLELYILNNDFDKAKDVVPELLTSFSRCKNHIDKIYHVGLFQSLFEYYSYIGDKESADAYYQLAINDAKKNYMKGKEKKLKMLKQIYE